MVPTKSLGYNGYFQHSVCVVELEGDITFLLLFFFFLSCWSLVIGLIST